MSEFNHSKAHHSKGPGLTLTRLLPGRGSAQTKHVPVFIVANSTSQAEKADPIHATTEISNVTA